MSQELTRLRLRGVIKVSFSRSEATNLDLYRGSGKFPGELGEGEAFLFISKGGNQVLFIFKTVELTLDPNLFDAKDLQAAARGVIDSRRLRLDGGTWHPYMLQNYANQVGLELIGFKRFEHVHAQMMANKRVKNRV